MTADAAAARLSERVDALAAALRAAGVPPSRSDRLLAAAAAATMSAVTLEALLEPQLPAVAVPPASAEPAEPPVRLAA